MTTNINSNKKTAVANEDALALLIRDHRSVEQAFSEFAALPDNQHAKKKQLADYICEELRKHMAIEEEIFYPLVKEQVPQVADEVLEGSVEHEGARNLMEQIREMRGDEELFATKVNVLAEQIEHHVKEEERDMFPAVRNAGLDIDALGVRMAARKVELQAS